MFSAGNGHWETNHIASCIAEEEVIERAKLRKEDHLLKDTDKSTLLLSGTLIDFDLVNDSGEHCKAATNPNHFLLPYVETDRKRNPIPIGQIEVYHLYTILQSQEFRPLRSLDPRHKKTTNSGTVWHRLLEHEKLQPNIVRLKTNYLLLRQPKATTFSAGHPVYNNK